MTSQPSEDQKRQSAEPVLERDVAPLSIKTGATILPDKLALLVSRVSYVGTLSIRSSALLAEAALEGARLGTITTLELGRKTLEGVVSSVFDILVRDSNNFGGTQRGAFGTLVEKYSNVGIYLVHHTFSLAELFSMSGFVLAQSTLSAGLSLAEESVRVIDIMFGSNETSRALASIVMLVAKELTDEEDKSWTRWLTGGASSAVLARLTKAATLFACLQNRTFERTKGELMGRVLWDVTVSSRENDDFATGTAITNEENPQIDKQLVRLSTDITPPAAEQLDAIDLDDAMTIVDTEEYANVVSAIPPSSIPQSTSTAFYEITTETTVTKTTTVRCLNSTQGSGSVKTTALRTKQINTTTEKSKYKVAVQKMTDRLKVKRLPKSAGPKITDITDVNPESSNVVKKALNRAKRGFSPNSSSNAVPSKRKETSQPSIKSEADPPTADGIVVPPIRTRDTKANILRTQAQTKPADSSSTALTPRPTRNLPPPLPPRPAPPRSSSLYRIPDHDRVVSPTKARQRRNSLVSISSFVSLRSDSYHHASVFDKDESHSVNFPPCHLVENLARFMKFSSASYGWNFMRLLGIGTLAESGVPVDSLHHANHHAFSQHTKLPLSNILLSSFSTTTLGSRAPQLVHFVSVDHEIGAVVLTCRGTLGLADILTDLACDYETIRVHGKLYSVHKGMLACAKQLSAPSSRVCSVIREALETNPGYGLALCGHSLGGGVAALLAILWACTTEDYVASTSTLYPPSTPFVTSDVSPLPAGRPIHAYTYGTPATVSIALARLTRGLITSVVHNWDVVPSLSMGMIRDLRHVAVTLKGSPELIEESRKRIMASLFGQKELSMEDEEYLFNVLTKLRGEMTAEKLVPPGQVIVVTSEEHYSVDRREVKPQLSGTSNGDGIKEQRLADIRITARDVGEILERRFGEIWFGKGMFSDHSPKCYEFVLEALWRGVRQGLK